MIEDSVQIGIPEKKDSRSASCFGVARFVCLMAVLVFSFFIRCEGIHWPKLMHPDEQVIVKWVNLHGPSRLYASGFFVLLRPVQEVRDIVKAGVKRVRPHAGKPDGATTGGSGLFLFIRWFNVWLGTLACLMTFLFVRRVTGSWWGGTLAAALMAGAHYPVEHCHYAETDAAMLFTLTSALWLWATAVATDRYRWLVAAAVAIGFAAGTKFILLVMAPPFLIYTLVQFQKQSRRRGMWAGLLGLTLICLFAGFLLANLRLFNLHDLVGALASEKHRLAKETARNMGALAGSDTALWYNNARWLLRFALSLGWGWLILCALAVPLLCRAPYRRYGLVLAGFPLLLTWLWVFSMPWVRSQEFMAFLPVFSAVAVIPVLRLYQGHSPVSRPAAWLVAGLAMVMCAVEGMRAASVFAWTDTRIISDRWLDRHESAGAVYMEEGYASAKNWQSRVRTNATNNIAKFKERKVEDVALSADVLRQRGMGYVIRNHSYEARGMVNPLTGVLFPAYVQRRKAFDRETEPLLSWSVAMFPSSFVRSRTSSGFTLANSTDVGLYGLNVFPREPDFPVSLPRPVWISEQGRETFMPSGREIGSDTVIQLGHGTRKFAVGGPEAQMDPVWLVLYTREGSVTVKVSGYGRHWKIRLAPYDAKIITLHRPFWAPRFRHWEIVSARSVSGLGKGAAEPCFVRVAFSAGDAYRCLRDIGLEHRVRALWPSTEPMVLSPVVQAELEAGAGTEQAGPAINTATNLMARMVNAMREQQPFRISGLSDYYYRQFSRMRIGELAFELEKMSSDAKGYVGYEKAVALPWELTPDRCQVQGECWVQRVGAHGGPMELEVFAGDSGERVIVYSQPASSSPEFAPVRFSLPRTPAGRVVLRFRAAEKLKVYLRRLEVQWDLNDVVQEEQRRLMQAAEAYAHRCDAASPRAKITDGKR